MNKKNGRAMSTVEVIYLVRSKAKKVLPYFINSFFSSIIFLIICVINMCWPSLSTEINQFENIDNLYIAAGGMFGAIATLTIALAIIPIQRAMVFRVINSY